MPVTGHYQISTGPLAAHVDVQEGEETFQELVRTLPTLSQISAVSTSSKDYKTAHSTSSRNLHDEEKGGEKVSTEDTEQPFDLHEYLTSSNDANQAAGVKHKHVSVTWKDLEISVVGGENRKIYIPTFGEDIHIATLTVAQSLDFALSTKTPGPKGRLPGVTQEEFKHTVRETLLKMLNISHTRNTLVGDQFVRGISGGERKRVSIAEMMATRARVQCWDNSTRGLDASTALDFARSLRIMTDVLGQTTFVTL
ncbi:hypothetical protein ID866_9119 [Astraeus odoratus]|nr:hypothetical protein ID866_9119 [Astraeus odoratus]